jgi:branched-chain amino acid transport system ATP-binding protein/branched-chain amino acid transport system permease protein
MATRLASHRLLPVAAAVVVVTVAVLPLTFGSYLITFVFTLIIALVLAQSWDWIGGQMGYINLAHYSFYGVGAYALAILVSSGTSVLLAMAVAAFVSGLVALTVAYPLFRLRGDYFAFATLALLPLCQILAFNLDTLTGGAAGIPLPPHYVLTPAYYMAILLAVITFIVSMLIDRARFGYALKAIRNDEQAAALAGIHLLPVKIAVLTLSALFAGLAGAVQTWQIGYLDPPSAFGVDVGLVPIAMALLGGSGLLLGPLAGVIVLGLAQHLLLVKLTMLQTAVYGGVILLVGRFMPGGLLRMFDGAGAIATSEHIASGSPSIPITETTARVDATHMLECRSVTIAFGGLKALDNVSLSIPSGQIVGLVGPNGSGKTTLFNCISKVFEPTTGEIRFDGNSLSRLRPDRISRLGVGRTYQIPRPFSDLTVEENVLVPLLFRDRKLDAAAARPQARDIAAFAGLGSKLRTRADALSLQDKKALEFARALACKPRLLLVDEVASGLTPTEVRQFTGLLRQIRDHYGITIIWVEHIFWALAEIVDRLVVMNEGRILADGALQDIVRNEDVLRAYLGSKPMEFA